MAQFTAYENPNTATNKTYPYLLDIHSDLLDDASQIPGTALD